MRSLQLLSALLFALTCLMAVPSSALAQNRGEEEARRQLEFAKEEVADGNYEKGLSSADSALRLYPSLYEAYVYKALAYEGLGKLKMAESFLLTYRELRGASEQDPVAEEALTRIQEKLGRGSDPPDPGDDDDAATGDDDDDVAPSGNALVNVGLDDMPELPSGSEEFLSWLVLRQQVDTFETRRNAGAGLTAGGLGLVGVGVGLMVGMSLASANNPDDANVEAVYAAGVGSVLTGGTLAAIGLPTLAVNAGRLGKLKKQAASADARAPRLELNGPSLALKF